MKRRVKMTRTDRYRGGRQFVEQQTPAWFATMGYLVGRGNSSVEVADLLGTTPESVRHRLHTYGIRIEENGMVSITIPMRAGVRAQVAARARQRGLSLEEYCRRLLACATVNAATYDKIVPGDQFA